MNRIAENIIIKTELKTDFVLDYNGNPTQETYNYKEYDVVDGEGFVLETGSYTEEEITVEEILNKTGIAFGISTWIYDSI
jgi:predicted secreted protein